MWRQYITLRLKLTLLYLGFFGVILVALCIVVLTVWEKNVLGDLNERLIERAESAVESMQASAEASYDRTIGEPVVPQLRLLRRSRYYIQLRDADGGLIVRSINLGAVRLPLPQQPEELKRTRQPRFDTIEGEKVRKLLGADGQIRLLTNFYRRQGLKPFYLQVGLNMGPYNRSRDELRGLFAKVVPLGLLLAGVTSWFVARRSLAPLRRIARQARHMTADRLDLRIAPPPARDEVGEMVVTINDMLDRLEAAFKAQERFVADAAHELKTPIAVVLGGGQVLTQKQRSSEEYQQFIAATLDEMRRLAQMVNSLLTLARADAGLPLAALEPVSINETITDVVQRWQPLAQARGVRLVPSLAMPRGEQTEPLVRGDEELLDSMVSNLVQNGIRYSPEGEAVEVEVTLNGRNVHVAVRDRGPGIPADQLDRVFERFYRVPRVESNEGGTGLGLAISRGVARLHGGSIRAANRAGGGCEFLVELPLSAPA